MTAAQILAELGNLRNDSGKILYKRLKLAMELLEDMAWVGSLASDNGGTLLLALEYLETDYFADICGALSLAEMLEILREVPDERDWKKNKYNLKRMLQELRTRRRQDKDQKQGEPIKTMEAKGTKTDIPTEEESLVARLRARVQEQHEQIMELKNENRKLRRKLNKVMETLDSMKELANV